MPTNTATVEVNSGINVNNHNFDKEMIFNKEKLLEDIQEAAKSKDLSDLRKKIISIESVIDYSRNDREGLLNIEKDGDTVGLKKSYILEELKQIEEALTIERATYYIERLRKGISETKTGKINDINLNRWKEYDDILTDSLWVLNKRDNSGAHTGSYWGNFIPQIPHQLMLRYTKKNDWVIDPFLGSGTTLIECRRLGRNGIGIDLNPKAAKMAKAIIHQEKNVNNVVTEIIEGDSRIIDLKSRLNQYGADKAQLVIMHPPYHDIIKFSNNKDDLSNASSTEEFINMFGQVLDNVTPSLERKRYLGIVIGDKYYKGTWIPLGFNLMNEVLKRDFTLKSIIVKNFEETKGKRNQKELWRYRALVGGFYIFKHEYILLFKKN